MSKSTKMLYGSICMTDMMAAARDGHPAFIKAANGKIYCNVSIWINDAPDQYDNDAAVQLRPPKDSEAKKPYMGNLRWSEYNGPAPVTSGDIDSLGSEDDLPF